MLIFIVAIFTASEGTKIKCNYTAFFFTNKMHSLISSMMQILSCNAVNNCAPVIVARYGVILLWNLSALNFSIETFWTLFVSRMILLGAQKFVLMLFWYGFFFFFSI